MTTRVLLYSGGLDSFAARHLYQPDVALYVNMATGYTAAEVERLDAAVDVVHLPLAMWERPDDKIIPLRNLFLVLAGAQYGTPGGTVEVALAATAGDRPLDKSAEFAYSASAFLTYLYGPQRWIPEGKQVSVVTPWKHLTKAALVGEYLAAGGDAGALLTTFSCYTPMGTVPCGQCKACARRWVALTCNRLDSYPDCRKYISTAMLPAIAAGEDERDGETRDTLLALALAAA